MSGNYYYYESSIKDDLKSCKRLEKFTKRESIKFGGASLIGMACYGILKHHGFNDLESNYPFFGLFLASYLESLHTSKVLMQAKERVSNLVESIDPEFNNKIYDILLKSRVDSTVIEKNEEESVHKISQYDEVIYNGTVLMKQEYNYKEEDGDIRVNTGLSSNDYALRMALK